MVFLLASVLLGCGEESALTRAEFEKLDARLQMLVTSKDPSDPQEVVVIIHTLNPDDIRSVGVEVQDVAGGIAIAHMTIPQLKRVVTFPTVQSIESNSRRTPQR